MIERGEAFALEEIERENGLGGWVDKEGEGAEAVESAEGMAGDGASGLLELIFWKHDEVVSVIIV